MDAIPVPLGKSNRVALIDPADAVIVVRHRWYRSSNGYAVANAVDEMGKFTLGLHRLLMGVGRGDDVEIDHINLDRLDNRRDNLRIVSKAQNDQNRPSGHGKSSYRGVSYNKDRWRATVGIAGRQINLGRYDDELDAARAAEAGRRAHLPFAIPRIDLEPVPPCPCVDCTAARAHRAA